MVIPAMAFASAMGGADGAGETRPNVIMIVADDLGYGDLSCYGGWINTPNIDRLALQGTRLTDFHTNGAVCSPTRGALLTGRYPQRTGVDSVVFASQSRPEHLDGLQPSEWTIAEHFNHHGYRTAMFGKWHLGYYRKYNPRRQGFDQFTGYVSGNIDFFSHVDQSGFFDWWQDERMVDEEGYSTHLITSHAVDFIDSSNEPYLLYVAHEAPHYPYQGPGDSAERREGRVTSPQGRRSDRRNAYREMVEAMDDGVGQIMNALDRNQQSDRTVVLFLSDNGATSLGSNGPFRGTKGTLWEGGHRVPALVRWPGHIPAGVDHDLLMAGMDLFPTLSGLCGLPLPEDVDGVDCSSALLNSRDGNGDFVGNPRTLYWEHGRWQALRRGPFKWIRTAPDSPPQLFDLRLNPHESDESAVDDPAMLGDLTEAWQTWRGRMQDMRTPQPSDSMDSRKPRVLIIGDSISMGYMPALRELAGDRWEIHHNPGNARYAGYGLANLHHWLGDDRWDVIHFNWGLWDLCYRHPESTTQGKRDKVNGVLTTTPDDYRRQLEMIATILKRSRANLVWASTTPVPDGEAGRFAGDEIRYNSIAARVMEKHGIPVNDLHGAIRPDFPDLARGPGDVHLNAEGSRRLALEVIEAIEKALQ